MEEKYNVIYLGYNGGWQFDDEKNLDEARKLRDKLLNSGYKAAHIIKIIE